MNNVTRSAGCAALATLALVGCGGRSTSGFHNMARLAADIKSQVSAHERLAALRDGRRAEPVDVSCMSTGSRTADCLARIAGANGTPTSFTYLVDISASGDRYTTHGG